MFSCSECDLIRHTKRHNNTAPVHNAPPKIACHEPIPNIIDPPTNDNLLQDIEHQELSDMINSQEGFGVTQMTPTDATLPDEVRQFFLEMSNLGAQTEIFDKFISKIFLVFAILKPSTVVPEFILDIYAMIVLFSLKPLPTPLRIFFIIKPMHSRLTSLFHSFCNTEKLVNFVIIMQVIIISC